ncbi:WS/DGAT domain-containing protein [Nocardia sp. PE-7]|uniref:WS/DGAT domain-containing protein n=1 Tax=Nocardia sp. PE-7 TaxID=3058426 RepID=UPI00265A3406|nr:WS/DGAT domain-containing protein [Nocardia sp. PE-7]WKG09827.1 WS/DGAT domain-containing protein [Nocardia sp. PE-7]
MTTMAARDATMYWLSRRTVNDVFLLYSFAETDTATDELRDFVAARAARIPDLRIRLEQIPGDLGYPRWVPAEFTSQQFIHHRPDGLSWQALLAELGELLGTGVVATEYPWRIHVFRAVHGAPRSTEPVVVVVLQLSHALADGTRAAAIARALFGTVVDDAVVHSTPGAPVDNSAYHPVGPAQTSTPPVDSCGQTCGWIARRVDPRVIGVLRFPGQLAATVWRGRAAYLAQRELADRTAAGEVPAAAAGFAPSALNPASPVADHTVRMLVVDVDDLRIPGKTVTVVALTAISSALVDYLAERGERPERLGTALPMALPAPSKARNNYRGLSIDLHIDEFDLCLRANLIADDLATRRKRALDPLLSVQDRVGEVVPAVLAVRDVERADLDDVPAMLDGNTVVSSVYRGQDDLAFAGGPVLFTGGFPALGSVMHLTHGVHGIGETITLSVHSDPQVIPDPDRYLRLLAESLDRVVAAHR